MGKFTIGNPEISEVSKPQVYSHIVIPEVRNVTHIKDVSPEVLEQCSEMIKIAQTNIMIKVQDLQIKNRDQVKLNRFLVIALIIIIISHLI